jgi:hypothetical protein
MLPALGAAAYAFTAQMQRFERSAQRVAGSAQPNYLRETVEQMSAEHAAKADVAILRATDELVGTLFDIIA